MRLICRVLVVCFAVASTTVAAEPVPPLWEGIERTPQMDATDRTFLESVRNATNGDLASGARRAVQAGWAAVADKDFDRAIRRFNQAWLLDPSNAALYWGLAIATHERGDGLAVSERWFSESEKRLPTHSGVRTAFYSDRGRLLEQSGKPAEAVVHFEKALDLSPNHREAHIGLVRAYGALGDKAKADEHRRFLTR